MKFIQPHPPASPEELRALIAQHKNKKQFVELVERRFRGSPRDIELISEAYEFFSKLFHGKRRLSGGSVMNGHLIPVAVLAMEYWDTYDAEIVVAALGHDSIEDFRGVISKDLLAQKFTRRSSDIIFATTKPERNGLAKNSKEYSQMIVDQAETCGEAGVFLKCLCDRLQNLLTLWGSPDKKRYKIWETEQYIVPLMKRWDLPLTEMQQAIMDQRGRLLCS